MSYTNGTTHYNLPQTTGSDKRDWADTNQAFADVDAALYSAVQDAAQAELDIDALETRMDTAEGNIATNAGDISALDTRLTTAEGAINTNHNDITDVRSDAEDMICAYNEATATSTHAYTIGDYFIYNDVLYRVTANISIGDTIVPDTNCATTNITTELLDRSTKLLATVTGDGSKTYTELLNQFRSLIDPTKEYRIVRESTSGAHIIFNETWCNSGVVSFHALQNFDSSATVIGLWEEFIQMPIASDATYWQRFADSTTHATAGYSNNSASVATLGTVFRLYEISPKFAKV